MGVFSRLFNKHILPYQQKIAELEQKNAETEQEIAEYKSRLEGYEAICENIRNINAQLEGYGALCENIRNINAQLEGYESLSENVRNLNVLAESSKAMAEGNEKLAENVRNINRTLEGYGDICQNIRNNNVIIDRHSDSIGRMTDEIRMLKFNASRQKSIAPIESAPVKCDEAPTVSVRAVSDEAYRDIDYFDFENHFRGSTESIKEAQRQYIGYYKGCKNVIDIGCGRGEFLELLKENGIGAVGVDIYDEFAEFCRSNGLEAISGDGIAYLSGVESTDGIFAGQVIEHLTLSQLIQLIETAYEKLEDGKCLIMETPNPCSLSIYVNAFYLDPSHQKPVHPKTVEYLLRNAGFREVEIIYTENSKPGIEIPEIDGEEKFNEAMKTVENMFFGSQDYAIIARK